MPLIDDRFTNVLAGVTTQSVANDLSFLEVNTGVSLGQQLGLIIDRVSYYPSSTMIGFMTALNDTISFGVTTSNQVTDLDDPTDNRILSSMKLHNQGVGTPASAAIITMPFQEEFAPPMIVASPRMYFAVTSVGLANPQSVRMRLYYRYVKLTTTEYLEIAETFILTG